MSTPLGSSKRLNASIVSAVGPTISINLLCVLISILNKLQRRGKIEVDELIFAQNPEPVRGKLDVYASMARGVKYNVDVAAQEMNKKLFSQNQNMAPQDIIQNMMK